MYPFPKNNLAALKCAVYAGGFLLIAGIIVLGAVIHQRNNNSSLASGHIVCNHTPVSIITSAPIDKFSTDGTTLTLLTKTTKDGSQQLLIVDSCKNAVIEKITIRR